MNSRKQSSMEQEERIVYTDFRQTEDYAEIDLVDLCMKLLYKLHCIIFSLVLGAVLFGGFAYFVIHPTYESTSKIYVVSSSDDSVVDLSDLNMGTSLTKDYEELILSYPLLNKVIETLELDIKYDELAKMITLTNPGNTRVLRISVKTTDPQLSCDIANEVAEVATVYLPETMGTIAPNIAQKAQVAEKKAGPSYLNFTLIGAAIGTLICCIFIILVHLLDDTIHSSEDMEKYFGIVPLTSIPDSDQFVNGEDGKKNRHRLWRRGN